MKKIQAIICSTILLSTLSASPVYAESNPSQQEKVAQNTSKAIDFNKAQTMSPKELIGQLTPSDKQLHNKDATERETKNFYSNYANYPKVNQYIASKEFKTPTINADSRMNILPKYHYKSGKYIGVIIHETANPRSVITGEINYMYNHFNSAFVHAYVDANNIIQTAPANFLAWGAGPNANPYFYQIELVRHHTFDEFARSVNNDAYLTAFMLKQNGLKPSLADNNYGKGTVISHDAISRYWGATDHTDPIGYFSQWGYDMNQFFELVQKHYAHMTSNKPVSPKPKPNHSKITTSNYKVGKGDTLYNISKRSGKSIKNIKKWNNLKSNTLSVGQILKLTPPAPSKNTKITLSTYRVTKGDTLYNISKRSGKSMNNIKKWSYIKSNQLKVGQTLYLVPTYKVAKGDTLYRIARKHNKTVDKIKSINNLKSNTIRLNQILKIK